jgi:hypothetical protein
MMYYGSKNWTGSVLRSNNTTPYYDNARDPHAAPYLNQPADHDVVADRPALAALKGKQDTPRPDPRTMYDERGQCFYKSKNGPGDRGADHVSYDYDGGRHEDGRM